MVVEIADHVYQTTHQGHSVIVSDYASRAEGCMKVPQQEFALWCLLLSQAGGPLLLSVLLMLGVSPHVDGGRPSPWQCQALCHPPFGTRTGAGYPGGKNLSVWPGTGHPPPCIPTPAWRAPAPSMHHKIAPDCGQRTVIAWSLFPADHARPQNLMRPTTQQDATADGHYCGTMSGDFEL